MGYVDEIKAALSQAADDADEQAMPVLVSNIKSKIGDLFNSAVSNFYDDYDPKPGKYSRKYRLYRVLDMSKESMVEGQYGELVGMFRPEVLLYRDGSGGDEDALYDTVFIQGYHGGAPDGDDHPSPGTPYWRAGRNYCRWGRPAVPADISPRDDFRRSLEDNTSFYEIVEDYHQLFLQYFAIAISNYPILDGFTVTA